MKAIRAVGGRPVLIDVAEPSGAGVRVKVVSSSICGSDLHMLENNFFAENIIGHEFAGITDDGKAVAIEPLLGCGQCGFCNDGHTIHCDQGFSLLGVLADGGMAEYVRVPAKSLIELPRGLDVRIASLVVPLAVAVHGVDRARVRSRDRVLVIGAGPIGLAIGAILRARGMRYDITARYEHQQQAAERLGADVRTSGHYDVVVDAVGSSASLQQATQSVKPMGRIALVGMFWEATGLAPEFCTKEVELVSVAGYHCKSPTRSFAEARIVLHEHPDIAQVLISHRFPLEGYAEAFDVAADRSAGAIKIVFDIGSV